MIKKKLDILRNCTPLTPTQKVKVLYARKQAENYTKMYRESNPNDIVEVDYSIAEELEYSYRYMNLQKTLTKNWKKYSEGITLDEFTDSIIDSKILEKNPSNKKRS